MPNNRQFWRIVALIGLAHVVGVVGLARWNSRSKKPDPASIVWINGDLADGEAPAGMYGRIPEAKSLNSAEEEATPAATPMQQPLHDQDSVVLTSAKSDIELPVPTATPTPTPVTKPSATPLFKGAPKPSPKPPRKPRPKPSPKPTSKPTPKPKPKPKTTVLAKASPKPSPDMKSPSDNADNDARNGDESDKSAEGKAAADANNVEHGGGDGNTGHGTGATKASELASYGRMLHDRLYSEWIQPTSSAPLSAKISTMVRVRIEKDGRISSFEIIKSSGNIMIDESVSAIGKRVSQVEPLPATLRGNGHYDVKINFELNSE